MNSDYEVKCFSGKLRMQSALNAAFDKVADKANWKLPVEAVIDAGELELIADAVVHFTGSELSSVTESEGKLRVFAKGYYAAVGA